MPTTQTYTYDPTDDSVLVEQAEARDAKTLEVGEKMMAEQENLLAGKYKNAEELEKAYIELQKKTSEPKEEPQADAEPEAEERPQIEQYTEDGNVNWDSAKEVYGDQLSDVFQKSEIDPFQMNKHFEENNGTLSDEMYEQLGKAGFSKNIVDSYLEGVRQQVGFESTEPAEAAPVLTETEVNTIHNIAGGKDGYENLMSWAGQNLSDEDAKNFDEVIETGNKAAVTFAVKALNAQYEDAVGRDSTLVTGKAAPPDTYRSMAEVVRDMNNPLYDSDEAYRADVRRKLEVSNLKV